MRWIEYGKDEKFIKNFRWKIVAYLFRKFPSFMELEYSLS
jgi:hypothetical protein